MKSKGNEYRMREGSIQREREAKGGVWRFVVGRTPVRQGTRGRAWETPVPKKVNSAFSIALDKCT